MAAVDNAIADYSGTFRLWLGNVGRAIKTSWIRLTEVADRTLFSVGEAPVTSGDIVQAFIILAIGWGLSRGIRIGIRRVGKKESVGRQAALYTISRLTHYSIILLALLIALTSIGLDFTNLALVAEEVEEAEAGEAPAEGDAKAAAEDAKEDSEKKE